MTDIFERCDFWAQKTYREMLNEIPLEPELKEKVIKVFDVLGIIDLRVNGYSCEKLRKTEESGSALRITFSEVFHRSFSSSDFSPVLYLVNLAEACFSQDFSVEKTAGVLARGIRTFASLLKEPDFAEKLKIKLSEDGNSVNTTLNTTQDSKDHTDVLLECNGKDYRIWLYIFSSRGLPHDIERVSGKRGELPDGIHLLCPLHTEIASNYDKAKKQVDRLSSRIEHYKDELGNCSERAIKKKKNLIEKIERYNTEYINKKTLLDNWEKALIPEINIVQGWYFYSEKYIERVAKIIESETQPMGYDVVYDILTGPERLLGEINLFKKE